LLTKQGKIDKPALPFPEPHELAQARLGTRRRYSHNSAMLSDLEKDVAQIWSKLIPGVNANMLEPNSHFFDLGGHSIIAQAMLSQCRKMFAVDLRMKNLFQSPTLRALATEINRLRDPSGLRLDIGEPPDRSTITDEDYAADARELAATLPKRFPSLSELPKQATVLLTGATGFLGSFILKDLMDRSSISVIAHVRANDPDAALERVKNTATSFGIYESSWTSRLRCVTGDLSKKNLGIGDDDWAKLAEEVDVIIHNGAQVSFSEYSLHRD
jgi:L-2-aminoadipate reductase